MSLAIYKIRQKGIHQAVHFNGSFEAAKEINDLIGPQYNLFYHFTAEKFTAFYGDTNLGEIKPFTWIVILRFPSGDVESVIKYETHEEMRLNYDFVRENEEK